MLVFARVLLAHVLDCGFVCTEDICQDTLPHLHREKYFAYVLVVLIAVRVFTRYKQNRSGKPGQAVKFPNQGVGNFVSLNIAKAARETPMSTTMISKSRT